MLFIKILAIRAASLDFLLLFQKSGSVMRWEKKWPWSYYRIYSNKRRLE